MITLSFRRERQRSHAIAVAPSVVVELVQTDTEGEGFLLLLVLLLFLFPPLLLLLHLLLVLKGKPAIRAEISRQRVALESWQFRLNTDEPTFTRVVRELSGCVLPFLRSLNVNGITYSALIHHSRLLVELRMMRGDYVERGWFARFYGASLLFAARNTL